MFNNLRNKLLLFVLTLAVFLQPFAISNAQAVGPSSHQFGDASTSGDSSCHVVSHWKATWNADSIKPYGEVEWVHNYCGLQIQERSICVDGPRHYTRYSLFVRDLNDPKPAHCDYLDGLSSVSVHWRNNPNSPWSQWHFTYKSGL